MNIEKPYFSDEEKKKKIPKEKKKYKPTYIKIQDVLDELDNIFLSSYNMKCLNTCLVDLFKKTELLPPQGLLGNLESYQNLMRRLNLDIHTMYNIICQAYQRSLKYKKNK